MSRHCNANGARVSEVCIYISDGSQWEDTCRSSRQLSYQLLEDSLWRAYVQQSGETLDMNMKKQAETGRVVPKGSSAFERKSSGASGRSIKGRIPTGRSGTVHETKVEAVLAAAERSGLLHGKDGRIGGRVSPELVKQAKARTGIKTDTDLIEFALANVALEDRFAESFRAVRGTVDPDLDLGF